jgi:hypothetical protein
VLNQFVVALVKNNTLASFTIIWKEGLRKPVVIDRQRVLFDPYDPPLS